jgi:hypothetical protein
MIQKLIVYALMELVGVGFVIKKRASSYSQIDYKT